MERNYQPKKQQTVTANTDNNNDNSANQQSTWNFNRAFMKDDESNADGFCFFNGGNVAPLKSVNSQCNNKKL